MKAGESKFIILHFFKSDSARHSEAGKIFEILCEFFGTANKFSIILEGWCWEFCKTDNFLQLRLGYKYVKVKAGLSVYPRFSQVIKQLHTKN